MPITPPPNTEAARAETEPPVDPIRIFPVRLPNGGHVTALIAGEGGSVPLTIESSELQLRRLLPRDVAWALLAALSDGLLTSADAQPDWVQDLVIPVDADGTPFPAMPVPPELPLEIEAARLRSFLAAITDTVDRWDADSLGARKAMAAIQKHLVAYQAAEERTPSP